METFAMLKVSAALFAIAALGGLLMFGMRMSGTPRPPSWLAMGHGLLAAAGLTLLAYAAAVTGVPLLAQIALALLLLAAVGGAAINLLYHTKLLPLPVPMMIVHALLAVAGFVLLLLSIYRPAATVSA
jgi:hypothetical protein